MAPSAPPGSATGFHLDINNVRQENNQKQSMTVFPGLRQRHNNKFLTSPHSIKFPLNVRTSTKKPLKLKLSAKIFINHVVFHCRLARRRATNYM